MVPLYNSKKTDLVPLLVDDSRTEQAHRAGHDGSPWQCSRLAARTSTECLQQSKWWRKQQQWSRSMPSSIERPFLCVVGVHRNPRKANFLVESRASGEQCFAILGVLRLVVSTKVWAFVCRNHDFGFLFDCSLLACLTLRLEASSLLG